MAEAGGSLFEVSPDPGPGIDADAVPFSPKLEEPTPTGGQGADPPFPSGGGLPNSAEIDPGEAPPKRGEPGNEALPPAPASGVHDRARIFSDAQIRELSADLQAARENHGLQIYVAAYWFLASETIEERAMALQKAWIGEGDGAVLVYLRDSTKFTLAGSPSLLPLSEEAFVNREMRAIFAHAVEAGKAVAEEQEQLQQRSDPAPQIRAAVNALVPRLADRRSAIRAEQSFFRAADLPFFGVFAASALGLGLLFWLASSLFQKVRNRNRPKVYFLPDVHVGQRLGAPYSGGVMGQVRW